MKFTDVQKMLDEITQGEWQIIGRDFYAGQAERQGWNPPKVAVIDWFRDAKANADFIQVAPSIICRQNDALMRIREVLHNTPEEKPELLVFVKIENILDECEKDE